MRTLVIPDLHNQTEHADYWMRTQVYNRVVLLGDYFDQHDDTHEDAHRTAEWLRQMVGRPDVVCLWGNHDVQYRWPDIEELRCPGFTEEKAQAINKVLLPEDWLKLKLAHQERGWLLSHAGFHPTWIENPTLEKIVERCDLATSRAATGAFDSILGYGELPGGIQRFGGPLWMNWDSLVPIPGIHQVVGHSAGDQVRERSTESSRNYCLDVGNGCVAALLVDGEVQILSTPQAQGKPGVPEFQMRDINYHL